MIWIRLTLKMAQEKVKKMTVIQLVKSLERRVEIRDYIVHFIDGNQCDFLKLNANELIYVEEVK